MLLTARKIDEAITYKKYISKLEFIGFYSEKYFDSNKVWPSSLKIILSEYPDLQNFILDDMVLQNVAELINYIPYDSTLGYGTVSFKDDPINKKSLNLKYFFNFEDVEIRYPLGANREWNNKFEVDIPANP
jgi:hypothetical protein